MSKHILFIVLLITAALQYGCSKKEVATQQVEEPVKLNRDSVTFMIRSRPFYVAEAYRHIGSDSVDMFKEDTLLVLYRNAAYLQFFADKGAGYIVFQGGSPIPNTKFPGSALTFGLHIRILYPTEMDLRWDDVKGTMLVETVRTTTYFPMIVPGKKGYLDPASFRMYWTLQEAKDAVIKPSIKFIYEDTDPKLGKVTYKITLKPMYEYYRAPLQQNHADFVVF